MSSNEAHVSPGHFEWLVDGRSCSQNVTLDLYHTITADEIKSDENVILQAPAQE